MHAMINNWKGGQETSIPMTGNVFTDNALDDKIYKKQNKTQNALKVRASLV
jgi:hypothetical protein